VKPARLQQVCLNELYRLHNSLGCVCVSVRACVLVSASSADIPVSFVKYFILLPHFSYINSHQNITTIVAGTLPLCALRGASELHITYLTHRIRSRLISTLRSCFSKNFFNDRHSNIESEREKVQSILSGVDIKNVIISFLSPMKQLRRLWVCRARMQIHGCIWNWTPT